MNQAIHATRPGGHVGFRGRRSRRRHRRHRPVLELAQVHGGPAPVRRFLPEPIDLIWNGKIDPGKVCDLELPLDQAADACRGWTSVKRSRCSSAPEVARATALCGGAGSGYDGKSRGACRWDDRPFGLLGSRGTTDAPTSRAEAPSRAAEWPRARAR